MSVLAYIDPGSGSLLLQALLAALLSVPFFFRRSHRRCGAASARWVEAIRDRRGRL